MTTPRQVRDGLAERYNTISGLRGHPQWPGTLNPPAAVVIELDVDFDISMARGSDRFTAVTRLYTGGDRRAALDKLYEIAGQIKTAVEDDATLGGIADDSRVTRIRGDSEGILTVQNGEFVVLDFETEVIA